VTENGEDGGFGTHPGDPWHPGWSDVLDEGAVAEDLEPGRNSRRQRRRERKAAKKARREGGEQETLFAEDEALDTATDDEEQFTPAAETPAIEAEEAEPQPAWLAEGDEAASDESGDRVPVESPAWVGETTKGAEDTSGVFDDAVDDAGIAEMAAPSPPEDEPSTVESAVSPEEALSDSGDHVVDVAGAAAFPPEDEPSTVESAVSPEALEALSDAGEYGVAGPEAYQVLGDPEAEGEFSDWEAFADAPSDDLLLAEDEDNRAERVEAVRKRRRWPFRRRRSKERDEAEVPEEWPTAEEEAVAGVEVYEDDAVVAGAEVYEDDASVVGGEVYEDDASVARAEVYQEDAAFMPPPGGFGPLPEEPHQVAQPEQGYYEQEDYEKEEYPQDESERGGYAQEEYAQEGYAQGDYDLEEEGQLDAVGQGLPGGPLALEFDDGSIEGPLSLEFDDGTGEVPYVPPTYDPAPVPAIPDDRDEWVSSAYDPDATVEMGDLPEHLTEDTIYSGAVTTEHRGLAEEIYRRGEEDTAWQAMSAAMPGVETGVVGFEDVADLGEEVEYREASRSDFGARVATGLVLVVFLFGSLFVGGEAMAVFIGVMALIGIGELYVTLRRLEFRPLTILGYAGAAGVLAAAWFHGPVAVPIGVAAATVLVFFVYAFAPAREDALADGALTVLGIGWVAGTMAFAYPILRVDDFRPLVLALVLATVAMDVGAYSIGRTMGRRALAPVLSPNKSVEGLIGGAIFALAAGAGFAAYHEAFELIDGIAVGLVVVLAAPLGDLVESMIKRSLGVKDMGTILPGHGGVLDRVDAFLFVLPAVWVLYQVTGRLG
jgi:phosphatidate cytidylyltransferase